MSSIAYEDVRVKSAAPPPAEAATGDGEDDAYRGIVCHDDGIGRHSWCPGCSAEGESRDDAARWARPPAEAADYEVPAGVPDSNFDGYLTEPSPRPGFPRLDARQLRDMAYLNAVEDFELEAIDP